MYFIIKWMYSEKLPEQKIVDYPLKMIFFSIKNVLSKLV